jgi:hypothetical protein
MQKLSDKFAGEKQSIQQTKTEWSRLLTEEMKVREAIQMELQSRIEKAKEEIRNLKNILVVPRRHFQYLEKMKYEDIVTKKKKLDRKAVRSLKNGRIGHGYRSTISRNITPRKDAILETNFSQDSILPSIPKASYMNHIHSNPKFNLSLSPGRTLADSSKVSKLSLFL